MKISIGSDHAGFNLKKEIINRLQDKYILNDVGCYDDARCDYPVYAGKVATDVLSSKADFGILICSTGIGMSIAANKYRKIRAALVTNSDAAYFARAHNDANIICIGAKYHQLSEALDFIDIFLHTDFLKGRHERRISLLEKES